MKKSTTLSIHVALGLYIALSLFFIGATLWDDFKADVMQSSFDEGRQVTIEQLITQAKNANCQPFSIFTDSSQIELVSMSCLEEVSPEINPESTDLPQ